MTRTDFAEILHKIGVAVGKPLAANEREADQRAELYWSLFKSTPLDAMRIAAARVVLSCKWYPTPAELASAIADTVNAQIVEIVPAEAFRLAWRAAAKIDFEISGPYWANGKEYASQTAYVMEGLPPFVARALRAFGIRAMATGKEPTGVVRAQFTKTFEGVVEQHKKLALMPAALKREIEQQNKGTLPASAQQAIGQIGVEK